MAEKIIYRVYTQDKNKRRIVSLTGRRFESFTLQPTLGYYRGRAERSIVIEIVGAASRQVMALARLIRSINGQTSVLVLKLRGRAQTTRC